MIDECIRRDLSRVYGSLTGSIIEAIHKPTSRLYLRVNTMLTSRGSLVDRLRERGVEANRDPFVDEAIYIPLKGPNSIPSEGPRITVDRYAAESIMLGANVYAPGVIGFDEFGRGDLVVVAGPNGIPVAVAEARVSSREAAGMRRGVVAETIRSLYRAPPIRDLPEYREGLFYPQSIPAMLTVRLLDPGPGELIIDMNAAPGGKTGHIVQATRGLGRIIAFERNNRKALTVYETLRRLHLYINTIIVPMDSRYADTALGIMGVADKVLIDPPCTGLGVRPKLLIDKKCSDLRNSYLYQRQFFNTAARMIRTGGIIVYSTCTLTFMENEGNSLYASRRLGLRPLDRGWVPYADKIYLGELAAYRFDMLGWGVNGYYVAVFTRPPA